jgi:hypothetical protein
MKRDLYNRWTKALRSGEYEQCKGRMRDSVNGGHCCLGVLLDLKDPHAWSDHDYWNTIGPDGMIKTDGLDGLTPVKRDGFYVDIGRQLARLNDDGLSFPEIADVIDGWAIDGTLPLED